jgi:Flp pilus assembly protein TadD
MLKKSTISLALLFLVTGVGHAQRTGTTGGQRGLGGTTTQQGGAGTTGQSTPTTTAQPAPTTTQPTTVGIRGTITAPNYNERIEVIIEPYGEEGREFAVTYTDTLGHFLITGLPVDSYVVHIKLDGFKEVRERVDLGRIPSYDNIGTVLLILNRNEPESALGPQPDSDVIDLKELTRTFPKKAVDEYDKGQDEDRKGNSARATEHLLNAIKISPQFYYAHNYLGKVYERSHRPEDAEREYTTAHDLNPRFPEVLVNLGRLYVAEADDHSKEGASAIGPLFGKARVLLEEAVKLRPNSVTAHYLLGIVYYRSSLNQEAELVLKRALELGDQGPSRLVLANVYIHERKWLDALDQLDAYLKSNPKAPDRAEIEQIRARVLQAMNAATTQ